MRSWELPIINPAVKINVDASILKSLNAAWIGVVARNFTGDVIAWRQRKIDFLNWAETAETIAVKHGIDLAQAFGFHDVIIESDWLSVVKAITSTTTVWLWEVTLWKKLSVFLLSFIPLALVIFFVQQTLWLMISQSM